MWDDRGRRGISPRAARDARDRLWRDPHRHLTIRNFRSRLSVSLSRWSVPCSVRSALETLVSPAPRVAVPGPAPGPDPRPCAARAVLLLT